MYFTTDTVNFAKEFDKELKAGVLNRPKLKVLIAVVKSEVANQKLLQKRFWEAWSYQGQIIKLRED